MIRALKLIGIVLFVVTFTACNLTACGGGSSSPSLVSNADTGGNNNNTNQPAETTSPYPDYNTSPVSADASGMTSSTQQLASKMTLGWNMGNTMEATGGETAWGNPLITRELIQLVKDSGFNAIRLPVAWDQFANQETAEIDQTWLNRVKEVVQYIIDADMYVLVNIHWDGGWLERNISEDKQQEVNFKQRAYWQQIATHLREFDERLLFASANEPHVETAEQQAVLMSYHQTFIDTVRETGGRNAHRVLVVQGPKTDIELTNQLWQSMPQDTVDDKLMMEVHFYSPYQFTIMDEDADWGKQFYYWGQGFHSSTDTDRNADWGEEAFVDDMFGLMKAQFVDQGIPVILGEYSATRRTGQVNEENLDLHLGSRAYYHKYVTQQAIANGLVPFYWDNGGLGNLSSGLFDRANLQVFDQLSLDALNEAAGQ